MSFTLVTPSACSRLIIRRSQVQVLPAHRSTCGFVSRTHPRIGLAATLAATNDRSCGAAERFSTTRIPLLAVEPEVAVGDHARRPSEPRLKFAATEPIRLLTEEVSRGSYPACDRSLWLCGGSGGFEEGLRTSAAGWRRKQRCPQVDSGRLHRVARDCPRRLARDHFRLDIAVSVSRTRGWSPFALPPALPAERCRSFLHRRVPVRHDGKRPLAVVVARGIPTSLGWSSAQGLRRDRRLSGRSGRLHTSGRRRDASA